MDAEGAYRGTFAALLLALGLVRGHYGLASRRARARGRASGEEHVRREGPRSHISRSAIGAATVAVWIMYLADAGPIRGFATALPDGTRWLGAGTAMFGLGLLAWAHHDLGTALSIDLRTPRELVTRGLYARIRHPMYLATVLFMVGLVLLSANGLVLAVSAASIIFLAARVPKEEAILHERFGPAYEAYGSRTGRFLPRLKRSWRP